GGSGATELPNGVTSDVPKAAQAQSGAGSGAGSAPAADASTITNKSASLSSMLLTQLRALAREIGVEGASGMRKGELVAAIQEHQSKQSSGAAHNDAADDPSGGKAQSRPRRERRGASRSAGAPGGATAVADAPAQQELPVQPDKTVEDGGKKAESEIPAASAPATGSGAPDAPAADRKAETKAAGSDAKPDIKSEGGRSQQADRQQAVQAQQARQAQRDQGQQQAQVASGDDDGHGRQGRRGGRFRDAGRRGEVGDGGGETGLRQVDVLLLVAGILVVLDNYAFVRT